MIDRYFVSKSRSLKAAYSVVQQEVIGNGISQKSSRKLLGGCGAPCGLDPGVDCHSLLSGHFLSELLAMTRPRPGGPHLRDYIIATSELPKLLHNDKAVIHEGDNGP